MSDASKKLIENDEIENDSGEDANNSRKEESVLDLTCSICLEQMKKETRASIACAHQFCYPCIEEWAKVENSCPICKAPFYHFSSKAVSRTVTKKIQPVVDNIEYEDSESSSSHYIDDEAMEASNDETSEEGILQNREGMDLYGNLFCESETFGIYPYADDVSESTTSDAYDTNSTYGDEDSGDEAFVTDEEYSASSSDEGIHNEIERKEKHRKRNKKRKERMVVKKEKRKDVQLDQDLEDLLQDDMNQLSSKSQLKTNKISLSDTSSSSSDADEAEIRTNGGVKGVRNDESTQEKSEQIDLVDIEEVIGEAEERLSQIFIDSEEDGSILDEYESDSFIVSDGEEISLLEASEENEIEWSDSETSEERERERRRKKRKDDKKNRKKESKGTKVSPPSAEVQSKRNRKALLEDSESSEDDKKRKRLKRKKEATEAKSNGIQIDLISPHESKLLKRNLEQKPKKQSIAISLSSDIESTDGSNSFENACSPSGGDLDKENIGGVNATSTNSSTESEVRSFKRAYSNNRLFSPVLQSEAVSKPKNEKFKQALRKKREEDPTKEGDDPFNSSTWHSSISDFGMAEDDSDNNSTPLKRDRPCKGPASSRRFTSINLETGETTTSSYCVEKMDVSENGSQSGNDVSFSSPSKEHHSDRSKLFSRFNRSGFVSFVKEIERDQGVDLCSPKRAEKAEKERRREKWHRRGPAPGIDKICNGILGHRSLDESGQVDENRLESFEINFVKFLNSQDETCAK